MVVVVAGSRMMQPPASRPTARIDRANLRAARLPIIVSSMRRGGRSIGTRRLLDLFMENTPVLPGLFRPGDPTRRSLWRTTGTESTVEMQPDPRGLRARAGGGPGAGRR